MESSNATEEKQNDRMRWWRESKFGMFIHWGLYSIPAGVWNGKKVPGIGEWIMQKTKIPIEKYEPLADLFNPTEFDADEWTQIAKDAGMKYVVVTAKHHDGFCMFDTEMTDYNIVDATPFGRDPLKELAEACREKNIKLGFYYSQTLDWYHPHGMGNDWDYNPNKKNYSKYLEEYVKPQLRELLTNYGPVSVIWFDIGTPTQEQGVELKKWVRKSQSNTIISGRIDPGPWETGIGDYQERGDNEIPSEKIEGDWETPATMNDTWGYKSYDNNWKSSGTLIKKLVKIVSKGGNYLLNVGPTPEGTIPQPSIDRLSKIGEWLKINGESIYGTVTSPIEKQEWGRSTSKGNKIYLHVFAWPWNGKLRVQNIDGDIKKAYLLADPERVELEFERRGKNVEIEVPKTAPNPIDTVFVLET